MIMLNFFSTVLSFIGVSKKHLFCECSSKAGSMDPNHGVTDPEHVLVVLLHILQGRLALLTPSLR
jgi:hypothetical protein